MHDQIDRQGFLEQAASRSFRRRVTALSRLIWRSPHSRRASCPRCSYQTARSRRRRAVLRRAATRRRGAAYQAPLLLQYAGADERINAGWPAYEAALKTAGVPYEAFIYPGVQHGFNNDTTPRYDEAAAKLAWQRTIAFFKRTLQA